MDKKHRMPSPKVDVVPGKETGKVTQEPESERIYDLDAGLGEPADAEAEDASADARIDEAPAAPTDEKQARGKNPLKFARADVLDRFQEKNIAITRLTKEKAVLEKEKAAFEKEAATLAAGKEALETQAAEFKDKWLRSVAEFENYRKRSAREWELLKQQSRTEVILEVLNSLDDFERAFAVVGDQTQSEFVRGIRLIYNNLLQVLQKMGVEEIDALHRPFDPTRHMAIGQVETTEVASGHVVEVAEKGYSMNGNVIRPARVIVAK